MKVHHLGLAVADLQAAWPYYVATLGFRWEWCISTGEERFAFFRKGPFTLELVETEPGGQTLHLAFSLADHEAFAVLENIKKRGFVLTDRFLLNRDEESLYFVHPNGEEVEFIVHPKMKWA
ncbi:VOC family protein [Shouchella tritolerans]|uniref:VOC family protein n=1 Tax=Shouchella tritolerans TaxID=2979466 RepID=UPI00078845C4|nr:VOC family protein [Shouchella tritolerans]